ncbi:MAG: amidohydrolase [Eubacteriales bacterium]|nr:amidohydrolase [Eubacteriales bacterium]
MAADTIYKNGKIATVNETFDFVQAMAVKDGRILFCGSEEEAEKWRGKETETVSLEGRLVLPGTFDSHIHAAYAGLSMAPEFVTCEPEDAGNLAELNGLLAEKANHLPEDAWMIGWGFKLDGIREWREEKRLPDWRDIAEGAKGHPVILHDGGLHRILVSARALELAGITKDTIFSKEEGTMYRFPDGSPTGLFTDFGTQARIGRAAYHLSEEEMEACIRRMQRKLNSYGITSHTDIVGIGGDDLCFGTFGQPAIRAYERLSEKEGLTARVFLNLLAGKNGVQSSDAILGGLEEMELPKFQNRDWVRADTVKIFGDDGWSRDGKSGYCMFPGETDQEQIADMRKTILELHRRGWQMGIHLTGGKGIDAAVAALTEAERQLPGRDLRHFLLHGSALVTQNIADCAANGIELAAQAVGGYVFGGGTDLKTPLQMGMRISQGSDGPALPMNWIWGLHYLVNRENREGKLCRPELALDLKDAICFYTRNAAYQNHAEAALGSLEPGKYADFQILDRDLFTIDPKEIKDTVVLETVCGGKTVYKKI